jgi:hypothetical protein
MQYSDYLNTVGWKRRRKVALKRARWHCELCGRKLHRRSGIHIHHLTYARLGNERKTDLLALCRFCHAAIHGRLPGMPPIDLGQSRKQSRALMRELRRSYAINKQLDASLDAALAGDIGA